MKKNLRMLGFICLTVTLLMSLIGCGSKAPPPDKAEETVRNYLTASASLNWQEAKGYLTGPALESAEKNINNGTGKPVTIVNEKSKIVTQSNGFTIVSAETIEMPGHDRWNYRFYLQQLSGKWLIYKTEISSPDLPIQLKDSSIPDALTETVKSYVTTMVEGDQSKALQYLTGIEFIKAQREEVLQAQIQAKRKDAKKEKLRGSVSDFQLTPVGSGDGYFLVRATYTVIFPELSPIHKEVIYTATDAVGAWKIILADQVSGE